MHALIQIVKVNDPKSGVKDGRPWEIQDCECVLLKDDGSWDQVGVLMLPKDLRGKTNPGTYTGTFALQADLRSRRIEAVLTGLTPVPTRKAAAPAA